MLSKLVATVFFLAPGVAREYVHWGKSSREEELVCAWSGKSSKACKKLKKRSPKVVLKVGDAYAVDDFLLPEEFAWLASAYEDKKFVRPGRSLNATYDRVDEVSRDMQGSFEELVQRIHGHAILHIGSQSEFTEFGWAYNGVYYPDDATLRKYDRTKSVVQAHQDSGAYARCLSATLHTGQVTGTGGDIKTYTCRSGNCSLAGWQHDDKKYPSPSPDLLNEDNLQNRVSLKYKPGRLVYFLAETVHAVTAVEDFDRQILFIWFSCTPTFANGNIKAGHMALVRHLVEEGADVNIISPDTRVTPAYFAAVSGHVSIISYLDKLGAPMDIPDAFGRAPIHIASEHGYLSVARYLTNLGSRVDTKRPDTNGLSPLMISVKQGHVSVVAHLFLQNGDAFDPKLLRLTAERGHCSILLFLARWTEADVCQLGPRSASFLRECASGVTDQARETLSCKNKQIGYSSHVSVSDPNDLDEEAIVGFPHVSEFLDSPSEIEELCPEFIVPKSDKLPGSFPLNITHLRLRPSLKIRICENRTKESAGILAIEGLLDAIGGPGQVKEHTIPVLDQDIVNLLGRDLVVAQVSPQGRQALRVAQPSRGAVDVLHHHRLHHPPSRQSASALYASFVTFLNDEVDGLQGGELFFPTLGKRGKELDVAQKELAEHLHEKYDAVLQNAEDIVGQGIQDVRSRAVNVMCSNHARYFAVKPRLGLTIVIWHALGKRKGPYKAEVGDHWHTDCTHNIQKITLERFVYLRSKFAP